MVLEWVEPGMHTAADLQFILDADENQPLTERIPLAEVDAALRAGRMQLFRVAGNRGVVLTEIREAHGSKRLSLLRGAGRVGFQIPAILALLDKTRKEWGCECIETVVYNERIKEVLVRNGSQVEGFILTYSSERNDGQQEEAN